MGNNATKNTLYWVMCMFSIQKIDAESLCNEFYNLYSKSKKNYTLSDFEESVLDDYSERCIDRYTPFSSDRENYPDFFIDEKQLTERTNEVIKKLSQYMSDLKADVLRLLQLMSEE